MNSIKVFINSNNYLNLNILPKELSKFKYSTDKSVMMH